ncbi:phage terminase small subunit P27 family [Xanthobacter sp. YC-JY1]|uniref:phage terminase small subunit P27 family n=1 Tax=Xanthobacter sp. YC-JY1 TaxID=2419844 RepID=UPI001F17632D|nr:phage terminase small subunit P27 family [Xanthobacter sp. YC-JY1]UJX47175.1 phage terminase small subunit P27 family [Xanthobacter sp. YC-JY1]
MKGRKPEIPAAQEPLPDGVPEPPEWLTEDARAEWARVLPVLLVERRTITMTDLSIFANYCTAIGQVAEANRILSDEGLTFKGPSGPKRHPAIAIRSDGMTQARQMAAELGLTPASRGRPAIKNGGGDDLFSGGLFGDLGLN